MNVDLNRDQSIKPTIKLDQFLKFVGIAATGGHAKVMVQNAQVRVNGVIEMRRGRKLLNGDQVSIGDQVFIVNL